MLDESSQVKKSTNAGKRCLERNVSGTVSTFVRRHVVTDDKITQESQLMQTKNTISYNNLSGIINNQRLLVFTRQLFQLKLSVFAMSCCQFDSN